MEARKFLSATEMEKTLRPKTDKDFGAPPPGYVPGRGRGATGFASGISRNGPPAKTEEDKDAGDLGDANYDEFAGYSGSLFQRGTFDKDDDEADLIYDQVEARMESRRKKAKLSREQEELAELRAAVPNLNQQFSDLKRGLAGVSEEDWMHLPAAQERLKAKKVQSDMHTNAPDRLLASSGGPPGMPPGMPSSLLEVGEARKTVLAVSLDQESTSAGVDAQEYLSSLSAQSSVSDIAEVKKARLLFKSVTRADPSNATGWLAAARLEEVSNNPAEAKAVVARGLVHCPTSEDLWLTAARLEQNQEKLKSIIANAIRNIPMSVALWQQAAALEEKRENKIRVFQKSLELIPSSVDLWKALVNLTPSRAEAALLLERAVQCCPSSEEMWLTFSKISNDPSQTQNILNDARKAIPTSVSVWMAAAELADTMQAPPEVIANIVTKAIESLAKNGVVLTVREWLNRAASSAETGHVAAPKTLVSVITKQWIMASLETKSTKEVKREVIAEFERLTDSKLVAESILATAVCETPLRARKGVWIKLLHFRLANAADAVSTFTAATQNCPNSEVLWLMFAKYLWAEKRDVGHAKQVLQQAMIHIQDSEDIFLAAARIEKNANSARQILRSARTACPDSARLWIKAANLERQQLQTDAAVEICTDALGRVSAKDPSFFKLHLVAVHALVESGRLEEAAARIAAALDTCSKIAAVWIVAADIAIAQSNLSKARSLLERARVRLPTDENLWWKGFLIEKLSHGESSAAAKVMLARALQACPASGLLWACAIQAEPPATRHPKCLDALKRCPEDALVIAAVAKFFWLEKRQCDKARKWYQNAGKLANGLGQVWAEWLAFEMDQGDENLFNVELVVESLARLDDLSVNKGIEWNAFRKQIQFWSTPLLKVIIEFIGLKFPELNEKLNGEKFQKLSNFLSLSLAATMSMKLE